MWKEKPPLHWFEREKPHEQRHSKFSSPLALISQESNKQSNKARPLTDSRIVQSGQAIVLSEHSPFRILKGLQDAIEWVFSRCKKPTNPTSAIKNKTPAASSPKHANYNKPRKEKNSRNKNQLDSKSTHGNDECETPQAKRDQSTKKKKQRREEEKMEKKSTGLDRNPVMVIPKKERKVKTMSKAGAIKGGKYYVRVSLFSINKSQKSVLKGGPYLSQLPNSQDIWWILALSCKYLIKFINLKPFVGVN